MPRTIPMIFTGDILMETAVHRCSHIPQLLIHSDFKYFFCIFLWLIINIIISFLFEVPLFPWSLLISLKIPDLSPLISKSPYFRKSLNFPEVPLISLKSPYFPEVPLFPYSPSYFSEVPLFPWSPLISLKFPNFPEVPLFPWSPLISLQSPLFLWSPLISLKSPLFPWKVPLFPSMWL